MRLFAAALLALSLLACSGEEEEEPPPPTPSPTAEAHPPVTLPTPDPNVLKVPATLWLLDASNGRQMTLFEDYSNYLADYGFLPQGQARLVAPATPGSNALEERILRHDGAEVSRRAVADDCRTVTGGAEVLGKFVAEVACGLISPNQRWMFYRVEAGEVEVGTGGYKVPQWDAWAVDLRDGERFVLQAGLRDCGGCDGRFGPGWSPGGDYIYFSETGGNGGVWLSDLPGRTTRSLTNGANLGQQPRWHPQRDVMLRHSEAGRVLLDDAQTGTINELPINAPAAWDPSGHYAYNPVGTGAKQGEPLTTSLVDVTTGQVVATLSGAAPYERSYREGPRAVVATAGGFIAALENADGCDGTAIYRNTTRLACIEKAAGASISPDGTHVALSRKTGQTGRADSPTIQTVSLNVYEVLLLDVASGSQTVLAKDAKSDLPPVPEWDAASSKLLVYWPISGGL